MKKEKLLGTELQPINPAEEQLITQAVKGDNEAYGKLYELYYPTIMGYVNSFVHNFQIAEDITEQTFLNAFKKRMSYEHRGYKYSSWLLPIAHNLTMNYLNRHEKRYSKGTVVEEILEYLSTREPHDQLYKRVEDWETLQALYSAIAQLPERQREVVRLKYAEDYTNEQIAAALRTKVGSVKSLYFRALENLHSLLTGIPKKKRTKK